MVALVVVGRNQNGCVSCCRTKSPLRCRLLQDETTAVMLVAAGRNHVVVSAAAVRSHCDCVSYCMTQPRWSRWLQHDATKVVASPAARRTQGGRVGCCTTHPRWSRWLPMQDVAPHHLLHNLAQVRLQDAATASSNKLQRRWSRLLQQDTNDIVSAHAFRVG